MPISGAGIESQVVGTATAQYAAGAASARQVRGTARTDVYWTDVAQPAWFTRSLPFTVQQMGRHFRPDPSWRIEDFQPTGVTYYVDLATGSDAAAGTSGAPLKSLHVALGKADVDVVLIRGGWYPFANGWGTTTLTRSVSIKSWDGLPVRLGSHATGYSWTQHLTYPTVYYRVTADIRDVWDAKFVDAYGEYERLTLVADVATVASTPGSKFFAGSTYVHLADGRAPDGDVLPMIDTASNAVIEGGVTVYLENINFEAGSSALILYATPGNRPTLYAKDCSFRYAGSSNGLSSLGGITFLQNCVAAKNTDDGFNYHSYEGFTPLAVEIDCTGISNGVASDTDNGSTIHDGGSILRLNGAYHHNRGRNVHDVTSGTQSWNLGAYAHDSASAAADADFAVGTGASDTAVMGLDCCRAGGSATDLEIAAAATGYVRHFISGGSFVGSPVSY